MLHFLLSDWRLINSLSDHTGTELKFWKVKASDGPDELRLSLLQMRELGISEFVLLATIAKTKIILSMARRLGIVAKPNAWLLLHLVCQFTIIELGILLQITFTLKSYAN